MTHTQTTLFDLGPATSHEAPPLLRSPDEVYEVSLTFQWDAQSATGRASVQAKNALTDELYVWHLSEQVGDGAPLDHLLASARLRWRHLVDEYRCPF